MSKHIRIEFPIKWHRGNCWNENHYKLLWFVMYVWYVFSQIYIIIIIYEHKYQPTNHVTQQCWVIFSRIVKHGYAACGWCGWAGCYYCNAFSKQWPTWSQVVAYLVFYLARNMQRLCFAWMQSVKPLKDNFFLHMWNKLLKNPLSKPQSFDH